MPAIAPSETAVITCLKGVFLISPTAYIPLPGYTDGTQNVYENANRGHIWQTERSHYTYFWAWNNSPSINTLEVDYLAGVRCMKDQSVGSGSNEDYTEGDDYEWND